MPWADLYRQCPSTAWMQSCRLPLLRQLILILSTHKLSTFAECMPSLYSHVLSCARKSRLAADKLLKMGSGPGWFWIHLDIFGSSKVFSCVLLNLPFICAASCCHAAALGFRIAKSFFEQKLRQDMSGHQIYAAALLLLSKDPKQGHSKQSCERMLETFSRFSRQLPELAADLSPSRPPHANLSCRLTLRQNAANMAAQRRWQNPEVESGIIVFVLRAFLRKAKV